MPSGKLKEYIRTLYEIKDYAEKNFYRGSIEDFEMVEVKGTSQGNFRFNSALLFPILTSMVNGGSTILVGGVGGGKTSYLKAVGAMLTNQPPSNIEESILRCHPQITEEEAIARFDYAKLMGNMLNLNLSPSELATMDPKQIEEVKTNFVKIAEELSKVIGPREDPKWRNFINPGQPWKIADEINLLSPYQQNMFLPIFGEGIAKYSDYVIKLKNYRMVLTMNWPEPGTFEWRKAFSDRIALAAPAFQATAPDLFRIIRDAENERLVRFDKEKLIEKAPKLGKMEPNPVLGYDVNTAFVELPSLIDNQINLKPGSEAEVYMVSLARELTLCMRCTGNDKGQAIDLKPDKLCMWGEEGACHYHKTPQNICYKTKGGFSVRALKECLYTYSKALAAFIDLDTVELEVVHALAPYTLLHRAELTGEYDNRKGYYGNKKLEYVKDEICGVFKNKIGDLVKIYEVWDKGVGATSKAGVKAQINLLGKMDQLIAGDYKRDLEKIEAGM